MIVHTVTSSNSIIDKTISFTEALEKANNCFTTLKSLNLNPYCFTLSSVIMNVILHFTEELDISYEELTQVITNTDSIVNNQSTETIKYDFYFIDKNNNKILDSVQLDQYSQKFTSGLLICHEVLKHLQTESNIITLSNINSSCSFIKKSSVQTSKF